MFTKKDIISQLEAMNAPRDSVVLAHTSLRAVGEVEGRAEGFLEALIEYFTDGMSQDGGLLCIPTHTWDRIGCDGNITLDMNSSYTCIGTLPSIAAVHPLAHRSVHPTHSMAVFGDARKAEEFIDGEVMSPTSTYPGGCYGRIYERGGSILLIGVGHNRDTYLHCVEEMIGVENRLSKDPVPLKIRLKSGDVIERPIHCHSAEGIGDVSARFPKYEPAFRHYGCIKDGKIGNADVQLCSAVGMHDVMKLIHARSGGKELLYGFEPLDEKLYM